MNLGALNSFPLNGTDQQNTFLAAAMGMTMTIQGVLVDPAPEPHIEISVALTTTSKMRASIAGMTTVPSLRGTQLARMIQLQVRR